LVQSRIWCTHPSTGSNSEWPSEAMRRFSPVPN
jgi:hypothetical protein